MPEWVCFDCNERSYGWGPRYGQPCPYCGGKLRSTEDVTIIGKEGDCNEATDGRTEEEDTTAV